MEKISRRLFIKTVSAAAALTGTGLLRQAVAAEEPLPQVLLGAAKIKTSMLAFGTWSSGWEHSSNQTRLGLEKFLQVAQHAHDSGITFYDTADIYGSHTFAAEALKKVPRDKVTVLSKIWPTQLSWLPEGDTFQTLDRIRKELGVEYIDILLMHNMMMGDWATKFCKMRDDLSEAKVRGIVRAVGISTHSYDALQTAAVDPWVEIILCRINHAGKRMDEPPEKVMPVLKQAHDNGKNILGMKIFGCGRLVADDEREQSLQYVLRSKNVDAMTIGFESPEQIDDAIARINRIVKEL
jgi:1-deoxyxylulose-5-phosphate synthase